MAVGNILQVGASPHTQIPQRAKTAVSTPISHSFGNRIVCQSWLQYFSNIRQTYATSFPTTALAALISSIIVTNEADNTVTVHDFNSGDLIKTFQAEPYGLRPRGIKVSPDGNVYIATLEHSDNFVVLDKDFNHIKTVKTQHDVSEDNLHKGKSPYGVSFSPSGDKLFVAASGGYKKRSSLEVYDGKTYEKINRIETNGRRCWHFTFTPDNKDILLACGRSDEVLVIDAEGLNIKKRIPVSGIPWGIITYPKALGSLDQPS